MFLSERFTEALIYATKLHETQTRKGSGVPYVTHLLAVASITLEYGGNEEEAIAALLHDAIEDQGGAPIREKIRQLFGETVTEIVQGCTDTDLTPKPSWRERKEAYISHLPQASASIRLVSAADKLHNARCVLKDYRLIREEIWQYFHGKKEGTLWYYRALITAFRQGESSPRITPLIDELDRVVSTLESLVNSGNH